MSSKILKVKRSNQTPSFSLEKLELPAPAPGFALIRHLAVPIEEHDINAAKFSADQNILGHVGLGVIEAVKNTSEDSSFKVGEQVLYYSRTPGSFATHRLVEIESLNRLPKNPDLHNLAANYYKGCAAHALTVRTYVTHKKSKVLIHGGGRVSSIILSQYAKLREPAKIIGVFEDSSDFSAARAGSYDVVLRYSEDWVKETVKHFDEVGANVCYDNIGGEVTEKSVAACQFGAVLVNTGCSSGKEPKLSRDLMLSRSLYYTVPSIFDYKENKAERFMTALEIFTRIGDKTLKAEYKTYSFDEYQKALDDAQKYPHYTPLITF